MISYSDFTNIELRVGTVISAEPIEKSEKLIKLQVDIGSETRQILAGIKQFVQPENLINTQVIIVANLEYRQMMGMESQGMLLAADAESGPVLLRPSQTVPPGTKIT